MNTAATAADQPDREAVARADIIGLIPVFAAICYPFVLDAFHAVVGPVGTHPSALAAAVASVILLVAFTLPLIGLLIANRSAACKPAMRRLAYFSVAAPTLYVFLGVVNYMAKSAYPDEALWTVLWVGAAVLMAN